MVMHASDGVIVYTTHQADINAILDFMKRCEVFFRGWLLLVSISTLSPFQVIVHALIDTCQGVVNMIILVKCLTLIGSLGKIEALQ